MRDLGSLPGGGDSYGLAMNANAEVTGMVFAADRNLHAFLYSGGTMRDLGTLPGGSSSMGQGINAGGQVVGNSGIAGVGHAFLYTAGAMLDLNDLVRSGLPAGAHLDQAFAINDRGQIIVEGCRDTCQAYRLDPVVEEATRIPALSGSALAAMAVLLLAGGMLGVGGFKQ
jgi:probable HAF family extracellular repeat protein